MQIDEVLRAFEEFVEHRRRQDAGEPAGWKPALRKTLDIDLERDMPLTAADLEALARARQLRPLPTGVYLEWLTLLSKHHPPRRIWNNTDSDEPFTL